MNQQATIRDRSVVLQALQSAAALGVGRWIVDSKGSQVFLFSTGEAFRLGASTVTRIA